MKKAKYISKYYDCDNNAVLEYEYRGKTYEVVDYGWKGGEPLSWQHANKQAHIDELIEREERKRNSDFVEEPAEAGLELFWKECGL